LLETTPGFPSEVLGCELWRGRGWKLGSLCRATPGFPSKPKVAVLTMKVVDDTTIREAEVGVRDVEIHLHASAKGVVETCALIPLDAIRSWTLLRSVYAGSGNNLSLVIKGANWMKGANSEELSLKRKQFH
jgi:hypothetical protein